MTLDLASYDVRRRWDDIPLGEVPDLDATAALTVLDTVAGAQRAWSEIRPRHRTRVLDRLAGAVEHARERLATLITAEMGKPLSEARAEVDYACGYLRLYAREVHRLSGRTGVLDAGRFEVRHEPVGTALLITPWNFPLALAARKLAPALAAGCAVVVKPAEETPLTATALRGLALEAGVPAEVFGLITTRSAASVVEALLRDGRVAKLSFTGSTAVGTHLLALAAENVVRTSMELGGNAPFVVLADADVDHAVTCAVQAKLRNAGQACTAANRLIVHDAVADEFIDRLVDAFGLEVLGDPCAPDTTLGPLATPRQTDRVRGLLDASVADGATALGGGADRHDPRFVAPTVLVDVAYDARIVQQEIFGPIAPVLRVGDDDEALQVANATPLGLAAYVHTRDAGRARRFASGLRAGMVAVNGGAVSDPAVPFGGVGRSGLGREGGPEGLDAYLEPKAVIWTG